MVIFHCYVSLPEGIFYLYKNGDFPVPYQELIIKNREFPITGETSWTSRLNVILEFLLGIGTCIE